MADISYLNFDPSKQESVEMFTVVPPGLYNVMIIASEDKQTSAGGKMLVFTYQIMDGPHVSTTLTDRLNVVNSNPKAENIGRGHLKEICEAIGKNMGLIQKTEDLHGKPFTVKVMVEEFESNRELGKILQSNKIEKRMPRQAAGAAAPSSQPKATANPW